MKWTVLAAGLAMSACATFGQLESGLNSLLGHDVHDAFNALGFPTGQTTIAGDTVYAWSLESSGVAYLPTVSTTTGYIGNKPVFGTTTGGSYVPTNASCLIRLVVNAGNRIQRWDYNGSRQGCAPYIHRIDDYVKAHGG